MKRNFLQHWASDKEKVEEYILDRLDNSEKSALADHLEHCEKCCRKVEDEKTLLAGIRSYGRQTKKGQLKLLLKQNQSNRREWTQVISIAAAIALMLGAVFTIQWLTDFGHGKKHSREIVINNKPHQQQMWVVGKIVLQPRAFRGTISKRNNSFLIKQGLATQTISIQRASIAEIPPAINDKVGNGIQTFLERTSNGLKLTLYTEAVDKSITAGIEVVTADSLIVYLQGQQIAYHIPGGWAGSI